MSSAVITVLRSVAEVRQLVFWSARFARVMGATELRIVHLSNNATERQTIDLDGEPDEKDRLLHRLLVARREILGTGKRRETPDEEPTEKPLELSLVRVPVEEGTAEILDASRHHALLLVYGDGDGSKEERDAGTEFLRQAPCDVLWMHSSEEPTRSGKILVPIAAGPNSETAIRRAISLADAIEGNVDALMVQPPIGAEAEAVGKTLAEQLLHRAEARRGERVHVQIVIDEDPIRAITTVCKENDYEIVLVGAAPIGALRRFFSAKAADTLRETAVGNAAFGVYRKAIPWSSRQAQRLSLFFRETVPQLDRTGRLELTAKIQDASSWNFDFVALVFLSTLIAGLGLMQDSTAVVIGAMLVAPLMTPLIGCGLAVVQGNIQLMRGAARAVVQGFLLAYLLGVGLGGLARLDWLDIATVPTAEMIARGNPTVIDLAIAIASGLAAAFATARPGLSGAIPGVAIAAALVPPIATSGIATAIGAWQLASGAFFLFFCNIFAIVVGAAISLYAVGVRIERDRRRPWQFKVWMSLIAATVVLLVVLQVGRS